MVDNLSNFVNYIRSSRNKTEEIHDIISSEQPDLLFLTETWLKDQSDEPLLTAMTPPGYSSISVPRANGRDGGGIAYFYRNYLERILLIKPKAFKLIYYEHTELDLNLPQSKVNIMCVYRPPPSDAHKVPLTAFRDETSKIVTHMSMASGNVILIGDFNVPYNHSSSHPNKVKDILHQQSMAQLVTMPTHKEGNIIDWVVTRESSVDKFKVSVSDLAFTDHKLVHLSVNISPPEIKSKEITSRDIKSINHNDLKKDLHHTLQKNELSADEWNERVGAVFDQHAPTKTRIVKDRRYAPWYSSEIIAAKKIMRKFERKWKKTGAPYDWNNFKSASLIWKTKIKKSKSAYYLQKFQSVTSVKQLFSVTDELLGNSIDKTLPTIYEREQLPEKFSSYFTTKIQNIRSNFNDVSSHVDDKIAYSGASFEVFEPVSEDFIKRLIINSPKKSCELDPFVISCLVPCIDEFLPSITMIINNSLQHGYVPTCYKKALIRPLLKKPSLDSNELKNYRPVSNLPFLSKILEKVVLFQLKNHLNRNNLTESNQSAYREHYSTETALLKIVNDAAVNADKNEITILCLLDLSAAFDTIDHATLIKRLKFDYGINGVVLDWFRSYLSNRTQSVIIDGVRSVDKTLEYGVPQGSVLGPVLFTMYMMPLGKIISDFELMSHFYADDSQIYKSCSHQNLYTLVDQFQRCFNEIKSWMNANKLMLNDSKTEVLFIGRPTILEKSNIDSINFGGSPISVSKVAKNLGVYIDSNLSFEIHVNNTLKNIYMVLKKIYNIRNLINQDVAALLARSLILPKIDYCNSLLANTNKLTIKRLQVAQNDAARLVFRKSRFNSSASDLLNKLHWLPVEMRIKYKICCIVYNSLHGRSPDYLYNLINIYRPTRTLRSEGDNLLVKPRTARKIGEQAFSFSAPQFWNSLP